MQSVILPYATPAGSFFVDAENPEHVFGRVSGGLAWPAHGNPGFLVVLAEDLVPDPAFKTRHIYRMAEYANFNGLSLVHVDTLLRAAVEAVRTCQVSDWFALRLEHQTPLSAFNRSQAELRQPQIRPIQPDHNPDFEFYASLVRARIHERKTLHFGHSLIPPKLMALPSDCSGERFGDYPELTALFMALAGLELRQNRGLGQSSEKNTRRADPVGGY